MKTISIQSFLSTNTKHPSVSSEMKRCLDVAGALVGLVITMFFGIAIAIKIDSPGSLFYSQVRYGVNGKPFRIWKFRSMVMDADRLKHTIPNQAKGNIFKNNNDPRVTKVGRFLRRTSLDELPQFWNVLKGEMSLVGTRPPTLDEVQQYQPEHCRRLRVKPGMTGVWQVSGRSAVKDFEEVVKLDILYQTKWSITYDLLLILQTIWVVFNRRGAC